MEIVIQGHCTVFFAEITFILELAKLFINILNMFIERTLLSYVNRLNTFFSSNIKAIRVE